MIEFRHMLDCPCPIGWRLTKGRGSSNLFVKASNHETCNAGIRARYPPSKSGGDPLGSGRGAAAAVRSIGTVTKSKGLGMSISVRASKVSFDRDTMWVDLDDGRSLGVPLVWFPRLMRTNAGQRENYRIGYSSVWQKTRNALNFCP